MELDTKGIPKESRNRCQKSSTINAENGNKKDQGNHQNHVSLDSKIIEIHCKTNFSDSLEGCAREW